MEGASKVEDENAVVEEGVSDRTMELLEGEREGTVEELAPKDVLSADSVGELEGDALDWEVTGLDIIMATLLSRDVDTTAVVSVTVDDTRVGVGVGDSATITRMRWHW